MKFFISGLFFFLVSSLLVVPRSTLTCSAGRSLDISEVGSASALRRVSAFERRSVAYITGNPATESDRTRKKVWILFDHQGALAANVLLFAMALFMIRQYSSWIRRYFAAVTSGDLQGL